MSKKKEELAGRITEIDFLNSINQLAIETNQTFQNKKSTEEFVIEKKDALEEEMSNLLGLFLGIVQQDDYLDGKTSLDASALFDEVEDSPEIKKLRLFFIEELNPTEALKKMIPYFEKSIDEIRKLHSSDLLRKSDLEYKQRKANVIEFCQLSVSVAKKLLIALEKCESFVQKKAMDELLVEEDEEGKKEVGAKTSKKKKKKPTKAKHGTRTRKTNSSKKTASARTSSARTSSARFVNTIRSF
jgi:hypothetical protein